MGNEKIQQSLNNLLAEIHRHTDSAQDADIKVWLMAATLRVWAGNDLCADEYVKALPVFYGKQYTVAQVMTALDCAGELAREAIIRQEIECELLEEKKKLIQAACYLRQPLDMAAIDAKIEQLREEKLREAIGDPPSDSLPVLSDEDTTLIQVLYREIVQLYHPQMHPEITEAQKTLFFKAQDAYRRGDLAALKLIHQMISSSEPPLFSIDLSLSVEDEDTPDMRRSFITDYSLAKQIYSCFCPTVEDAAIQEELDACKEKNEQVSQQVNEYDKWAIAVYLTEDDQIGYVSKFKNETIARLMDAGKKFIAISDDPAARMAEYSEEERARKIARWSPTENVSLPFCIYMVEEG